MALVNEHFLKLPGSYLFSDIAKKVNTFRITHPKQEVIRLGIGDVTRATATGSASKRCTRQWRRWLTHGHSVDMVPSRDTTS